MGEPAQPRKDARRAGEVSGPARSRPVVVRSIGLRPVALRSVRLRPAALVLAAAVGLCLALSACEQEPQKVQTQPTPSDVSVVSTPTSRVPEYTSKKKLSPAEKKAAEDALVVLEKYNREVVALYQRGGSSTSSLSPLVTESHLKVVRDELKPWKKKKLHMEGTFALGNRVITESLVKKIDDSTKGWVRVEACVPFQDTKLVNTEGKVQKEWATTSKTLSFIVVRRDSQWRVDDTGTESERC